MTGPLRLVLLGGLEVWVGERQVRGFESQRVRALLAYLAAQANRSISRELLASLFWPEHDEESAKRNWTKAVIKPQRPAGTDGAMDSRPPAAAAG